MIAILSDVHSNLEALEAVLADVAEHGVEDVYCLGDMVGYGPNPRECLDLLIERCKVVILGNHDQGVLFDPVSFNPSAERATFSSVQARRCDRPRPVAYATAERRACTLTIFLRRSPSSPRSRGRAPPAASSAARSPPPAP